MTHFHLWSQHGFLGGSLNQKNICLLHVGSQQAENSGMVGAPALRLASGRLLLEGKKKVLYCIRGAMVLYITC